MADFNKVGLLVIENDAFLVCRKNDYTSKLIMPGGQIEPGESAVECLIREVREELGENITLENIEYLGTYADKAASDDPTVNKTVEIQLYKAGMRGSPVPSSEVVELVWFSELHDREQLSAIIQNKILPELIRRKELTWS